MVAIEDASQPNIQKNSRATSEARVLGLLIVSPVRFVRESLGQVLTHCNVGRVLKLCANIEEALAKDYETPAELTLIDVSLPDAVRAVSRLRSIRHRTRIVPFAVTETEDSIARWAEAGADGYIPDHAALADFPDLVLKIASGSQPCSGRISASLFRRIGTAAQSTLRDVPASLTAREYEILHLIGAGLTNKEIARKLNIGPGTTKSHVHNLLTKLNLQRRGEASNWLHRHLRASYGRPVVD